VHGAFDRYLVFRFYSPLQKWDQWAEYWLKGIMRASGVSDLGGSTMSISFCSTIVSFG
jgi:hypothetical protein